MQNRPAGRWDFDVFAGAGALVSTGADMLKYLEANLHPEKLAETSPANADSPAATLPAALAADHQPRASAVGPGKNCSGLALQRTNQNLFPRWRHRRIRFLRRLRALRRSRHRRPLQPRRRHHQQSIRPARLLQHRRSTDRPTHHKTRPVTRSIDIHVCLLVSSTGFSLWCFGSAPNFGPVFSLFVCGSVVSTATLATHLKGL